MGDGSGASSSGASGALYGLGIFGAWVWFWQEADSFWWYVLAVLEGLVWPAFLVYHGLDRLAGRGDFDPRAPRGGGPPPRGGAPPARGGRGSRATPGPPRGAGCACVPRRPAVSVVPQPVGGDPRAGGGNVLGAAAVVAQVLHRHSVQEHGDVRDESSVAPPPQGLAAQDRGARVRPRRDLAEELCHRGPELLGAGVRGIGAERLDPPPRVGAHLVLGDAAPTAQPRFPVVGDARGREPLLELLPRHVGVAPAAGEAAYVDDQADPSPRQQVGQLVLGRRTVPDREHRDDAAHLLGASWTFLRWVPRTDAAGAPPAAPPPATTRPRLGGRTGATWWRWWHPCGPARRRPRAA